MQSQNEAHAAAILEFIGAAQETLRNVRTAEERKAKPDLALMARTRLLEVRLLDPRSTAILINEILGDAKLSTGIIQDPMSANEGCCRRR